MYSGLSILRKAVSKSSGWYQSSEWKTLLPATKLSVKSGEFEQNYWENIFMGMLSDLEIVEGVNPRIKGSLSKGRISDGVRNLNIERLETSWFDSRYWVYISLNFDDDFVLVGFPTKIESIKACKEAQRQADCFYALSFKMGK